MDQVVAGCGTQHILGCHLPPGVILIAHHQFPGDPADDSRDVSLQVLPINETARSPLHPYRFTVLIIVEPQVGSSARLIDYMASVQSVLIGDAIDGFGSSVSVGVIRITDAVCAVGSALELFSLGPGEAVPVMIA